MVGVAGHDHLAVRIFTRLDLEEGVGGANGKVVDGQGDGVAFVGRMDPDLKTSN